VAVVGATGSVGTTVAKMVARNRDADELLLVARNERRLDSLRCNLSGRGVAVRSSTDLHAIRSADVVVLLTAAAGSVLESEHLAEGAVVLDATQPRNTSTELARERRDVRILDGGIVSIPSLEIRGGNVGLPNGRAYACFAETALLALSGHQGHFSIGIPDLDQVDVIRSLAREYAHLGFTVAAPTSFGVPVRVPDRVLTDDATALVEEAVA
jgi:predicted amino acid dehydrogenase